MERSHTDLLAVLAYFYLRHDRPAKAAVLYRVLDALAPGDGATMTGLAAALVWSGRGDEAMAVLDRLDASGGAGASVHLLRSQALELAGRADAAAVALDRYLAARGPA